MYKFTEEQIMIRDMVREFTKNEVAPYDKAMDETFSFNMEIYQQIYSKLVETGLMGIHIPEQYGGGGGDAITSQIVVNELAKGSASIALYLDANWLASDMILVHGNDEQKQKYLPLAAAGKVFAFGLTEASAGSDAAGIKSIAAKQDDGSYILNGGKAWITNSGVADYYLIMAKTDPEAGARGISVFIVPKDAEGLTIGKFEHKMGMRGSATCELSFDNIRIPECDRVGREGLGFKVAMMALDGARISIGSIASGLSQHAMEIAKAYANERTTFGKPIKAFQGLAFRFADMYADIKAMELLAYDAATTKDAGERCTLDAAAAKLFATEKGTQICIQAQAVFGGNGMSKEYDIERLLRDVRVWSVMEGSTEILRMIVSGTVLAKK